VTAQEFLKSKKIERATTELGWKCNSTLLTIPYPAVAELGLTEIERRRDVAKPQKGLWRPHQHPHPYFLRGSDESPTVLVEGETDAATIKLLFPNVNVIGIPGSTSWRPEWWNLVNSDSAVLFLDGDVERNVTDDKSRRMKNAASVILAKAVAATKPPRIKLSITSAILSNSAWKDVNDILIGCESDEEASEILNNLAATAKDVEYVPDIARLLNRLDVYLRPTTVDSDGDRKAPCPFHQETMPSFDYGPKGATCFGCGIGVNIELLGALFGVVVVNPVEVPYNAQYKMITLEEVTVEDIEWLIYPYLPKGEIVFIEGDPGIGKSWVWMALVAGLTGSANCRLPFDHTAKRDCNISILLTEDSFSRTVKPRLMSMGANMSRIIIPSLGTEVGADFSGVTSTKLPMIEEQLAQLKPDLIVVDPLTLYASDVKIDLNNGTEVRNLLTPLQRVARKLNCVALIVRHWRKSGGKAIYRGAGSIDISGISRSSLAVARHKQTGQLAVAHAKHNISEKGPTLLFELIQGLENPFRWIGMTDSIDADDLSDERPQSRSAGEDENSKIAEARRFLKELLCEGPRKKTEIEEEAKKRNISIYTLDKAKKGLVISKKEGYNEGWTWQLS